MTAAGHTHHTLEWHVLRGWGRALIHLLHDDLEIIREMFLKDECVINNSLG